ncbi:MAG: hypothetical protein HY242_01345 [Afipia sp.]|nr:hypothetical protein [Afipia sp.]
MTATKERKALGAATALLPLWVGAGIYFFVLATGNDLLRDSDIFWQIEVGRWIVEHRAVPHVDVYSFTMKGAPWISSSWLAQVLHALSCSKLGWAGPVVLSSAAIGIAFAIFVSALTKYVDTARATILAMVAFGLSMPHLLARPHLLALPLMVGWFAGLMSAADGKRAPSFWLLPLIALWANIHGGFVLGLALIAPVALAAAWEADARIRISLALRWAAFAVAALLASFCTPYGWNSLLAARSILDLGEVLTILSEWQPANFSRFGLFEACLLGIFFVALWRRIVLTPPRILLLLGLIYLALTHVRSIEAFAFLVPLAIANPVARQLSQSTQKPSSLSPRHLSVVAAALVVMVAGTAMLVTHRSYAVISSQAPAKALAALKERKAVRILNGYEFGGYMIAQGVEPFIDGRAELYGEKFVMDHHRAASLQDPDALFRILSDYRIDAVLFNPTTPAVQLLDGLNCWQKIYADDSSAVYVKNASGAK